jgi:D,D-heptose 1,7-bisphosphate phosphatase
MKLKAVFLDKDGTIIPDVPYNVDVSKISLSESVVEGLQLLQSGAYLLVVVSNQSGVAYGYFNTQEVENVRSALAEKCAGLGIYLDGFYYCPHHPEGTVGPYTKECDCRKPQPGLLLKASSDMNIDLSSSWMIGDILNDVEAGNRAGCQTILINNGNETEWQTGAMRKPKYKAKDFADAARYILSANKKRKDGKKVERHKKYLMHQAG